MRLRGGKVVKTPGEQLVEEKQKGPIKPTLSCYKAVAEPLPDNVTLKDIMDTLPKEVYMLYLLCYLHFFLYAYFRVRKTIITNPFFLIFFYLGL